MINYDNIYNEEPHAVSKIISIPYLTLSLLHTLYPVVHSY